ncbi:MAG TPA: hypothetical protein VGP47_01890 [Parachlamydiaceae bacterium]|nr:hypothetical protein [Parachlamydiaceae bacterium]
MTQIQNALNVASETILTSAAFAGAGYLCARVFMSLNPVHAAVVSAVSVVVSKVTTPIFDKVFNGEKANESSRFLGAVLNVSASVIASSALATALGYPVSIASCLCLIAIIMSVGGALTIGASSSATQNAYLENAYESAHQS